MSAVAGATQDRLAIRCGALLDVRTGELVPERLIEVSNGLIVAIEPASDPVDESARPVVDLGAGICLPGLIDLHTHVIWAPGNGNLLMHYLHRSSAAKVLDGLLGATALLNAGFTTIRNVGDLDSSFGAVDLRDAIAHGKFTGPRMIVAPHLISPIGGHCDFSEIACDIGHHAFGETVTGADGLRRVIRQEIKYGADWIKLCATGGIATAADDPNVQAFTDEELQAAVSEAHRHGRRVAAHAHGRAGIVAALAAGVDTIEHASLLDEESIALVIERGAHVVPTMYVIEYLVERSLADGMPPDRIEKAQEMRVERVRRLRDGVAAGVPIAFGTDTGPFPHGLGAREFPLLVDIGLSPLEALQSATTTAAAVLDLEAEIGTLEVGKRADIIGVAANPLNDLSVLEDVRFVMRDGSVVRNQFELGGTLKQLVSSRLLTQSAAEHR